MKQPTLPEDLSLVMDTDDGLVVISGCGHAGIINTLAYAREFVRPVPIEAVIGGLHLFELDDAHLDWAADRLRAFGLKNLLGAHCTGIEAVFRIRQRAGFDRRTAVVAATGSSFTLARASIRWIQHVDARTSQAIARGNPHDHVSRLSSHPAVHAVGRAGVRRSGADELSPPRKWTPEKLIMKTRLPISCWMLFALALLVCAACDAAPAPSSQDGPAALQLKHLVAADPVVKRLLVESIEKARLANPDPNTNPAQTLEQYLDFVAWVEHAIPASLLAAPADATLYQRIDQSLAYLYFVCDQPLDALEGRGYLFNSLQYVEPYNAWLKGFVRSWGKFLDTRESWNAEYLRLAQADEGFGLSRGWYEDPSRWTTFNQFFARRLKSARQRPIAAPDDESLVVSPVDGTPQGELLPVL